MMVYIEFWPHQQKDWHVDIYLSVIMYKASLMNEMELNYEENCVFKQKDYLPNFSIHVSEPSSVAEWEGNREKEKKKTFGKGGG